ISPDGKRAVLAARGDVYTVPAKDGSVRNLTRTPGIREQKVVWSPDGRWIAYVSDRTGEDEIYIIPQDGMGKEQQITSGYKGFKYTLTWSPDSKKIAWSDKDVKLWYVDITDKKPVLVDTNRFGEFQNYNFSPDSKWLAYDKAIETGLSTVNLYSLVDKKITPITSSMHNSNAPIFDPDGKYLYFLSDRDYNEVLGNYDFEFANPKTTRVYIVTLTKDQPSPFPALSDETQIKKDEAKSDKDKDQKDKDKDAKDKDKDKDKDKEKPAEFRIDLDGIQNR